ncbi:hypothetical protein XENTR_v10011798 [Xenopus tropicalis]|nr:hypothetical protein XENTR_v10011798 [Xenopus tropicalis]
MHITHVCFLSNSLISDRGRSLKVKIYMLQLFQMLKISVGLFTMSKSVHCTVTICTPHHGLFQGSHLVSKMFLKSTFQAHRQPCIWREI